MTKRAACQPFIYVGVMIKQIFVVRKDLNMSPGKLAAQVAHASSTIVLDMVDLACINCITKESSDKVKVSKKTIIEEWLKTGATKIVLSVKSEEELLKFHAKALTNNLPCHIVLDEGRTEFTEPTFTVLGIGPVNAEIIDPITKKLRLYS